MKKLWNVLILTLALNFLAVAGVVGWLYQSKKLDREKVSAIKEIVFPSTQPSAPEATTQPSTEEPTTQPILKLDELLARQSGRSTAEQVDLVQHAFDAQMAQMDRRQRELFDLKKTVELAQAQLARDRSAMKAQQEALNTREQMANRLETDKGFQDSLALYTAMPGKKAKDIFMTLDDQTVMQYLQAMEPSKATKIIKEFKTPPEVARIQSVLERIRLAEASAKE